MKLPFNEWFPTWPKAERYEYWSQSQGTGLRKAHDLMRQASRDYQIYLRKKVKHEIQTTTPREAHL